MTPLKPITFRLETELLESLQIVKQRDGIPVTEQVRRGILMWLESKGVKKAERKQAATGKRSQSKAVRDDPGRAPSLWQPVRARCYSCGL